MKKENKAPSIGETRKKSFNKSKNIQKCLHYFRSTEQCFSESDTAMKVQPKPSPKGLWKCNEFWHPKKNQNTEIRLWYRSF